MLELILICSLLFGAGSYYLAHRHGIGCLFWTFMGLITGPLVIPFILLNIRYKHHNERGEFAGPIRIIHARGHHD